MRFEKNAKRRSRAPNVVSEIVGLTWAFLVKWLVTSLSRLLLQGRGRQFESVSAALSRPEPF